MHGLSWDQVGVMEFAASARRPAGNVVCSPTRRRGSRRSADGPLHAALEALLGRQQPRIVQPAKDATHEDQPHASILTSPALLTVRGGATVSAGRTFVKWSYATRDPAMCCGRDTRSQPAAHACELIPGGHPFAVHPVHLDLGEPERLQPRHLDVRAHVVSGADVVQSVAVVGDQAAAPRRADRADGFSARARANRPAPRARRTEGTAAAS